MAVVDIARGLTILSVTTFHFYADTRGVAGADASASAAVAAIGRGDLLESAAVVARAVAGLPHFRLDLLLFVTGLVLCLGRPVAPSLFLAQRARSILPNYWLGSLTVAALLIMLALARAVAAGTPFAPELHHGVLLAGRPYLYEWTDIPRSLTVVGRLATPQTMQVVAPSMWYLVLIGQLYLLFPWLRRLLDHVGPVPLLAFSCAVTVGTRALAFAHAPFGAFDANATVLYALPCRLISPALGMAAAPLIARLPLRPHAGVLAAVSSPVLLIAVAAIWVGGHANEPGTLLGVIGPALPLLVAMPGILVACMIVVRTPVLAPVVVWAGRKSLSLLVAQDFLRFGVGTLVVSGVSLRPLTWWLLPFYLGTALIVTRLWDPLPAWCASRMWPLSGTATVAQPTIPT